MSHEIELKLTLPQKSLPALRRHPLIADAPRDGRACTLENTYFDTPDLELRERRMAVRTRKAGSRWLQTVKCSAESVAGLSARPEWEQLASVIVMVDAPRFRRLGAYWPAAKDHLRQADTVVLNKLDQIDDRQVELVVGRVRSANPAARIIRAVHADVPIDQLLKVPTQRRTAKIVPTTLKDSTAGYRSGSFKILRPFEPDRLERWLKGYQRSVVRLKGYARVHGRPGMQDVQWVMG